MTQFRFAVIGCGRMGLAHSRRLAEDSRSTIVAFHDPDTAAAERLRDAFVPDATVHDSFAGLVAATDADAAVIATPTTSHTAQIVACAERGWHILTEKPLAESREKILDLIALSESSDRHFMLGYQRRCWANYCRLRDEVRSGRYGRVTAVTSISCERWQQTIEGTWRDDPAINEGGFIGDAGSHRIDSVFFVTGLRPTDVCAISDNCGSRVPIVASVTASLEGGVPLTMAFTGHTNSFHEDLFIHCEHADLILRDRSRLWLGRDNTLEEIPLPENESGRESIRNPITEFLGLIAGETANTAPFSCALPVFDFTTAVLNSSGATVRLD